MKTIQRALWAALLAAVLTLWAAAETPTAYTPEEQAQLAYAAELEARLEAPQQDPGDPMSRAAAGQADPERALRRGPMPLGSDDENQVNPANQPGVLLGIDVSHHQGTIDWNAARNEVDYVIIRCGYGLNLEKQDDRQWLNNVAACERLGIPYGVYFYSYATDLEQARSEADHALRLLRGHTPDFPVYYDLEDSSMASLNNGTIAAIAKTFCDAIVAAGYQPGIYANRNWWNTKLTDSVFHQSGWNKWIAHWTLGPDYSDSYDHWQYGGRYVSGISGSVDADVYYMTRFPHKPGSETLGDLLALADHIRRGTKPTPAMLTRYDMDGSARLDGADICAMAESLMK